MKMEIMNEAAIEERKILNDAREVASKIIAQMRTNLIEEQQKILPEIVISKLSNFFDDKFLWRGPNTLLLVASEKYSDFVIYQSI